MYVVYLELHVCMVRHLSNCPYGFEMDMSERVHFKILYFYVNVDFSFCLVLIVGLNYVLNLKKQNNFLSEHKLLPVNLTWLSQVYGKMFSFPISWIVLENVCLNDFNIIFFNDFPLVFQWWQILLSYCGWCYWHTILLLTWQMLCQLTMGYQY